MNRIPRLPLASLFFFVGLCAFPAFANASGFTYYRSITVDHTKVPNTDQTDFPVLVSGTYSYLATVGNGGDVQNSNGYDVGFYSDSGCATKLNWETERYVASTGEVDYWVMIPTLSHTTDTVFYLCYDNSSISSDQSNPTGVWDSNFLLVYHFPNGSSLSTDDSTSNAYNAANTSVTATAGIVDGGASFNGSSAYLYTPDLGTPPTDITLSAWVQPNSAGGDVFSEQGQATLDGGWFDSQMEVETNNTINVCIWVGHLACVTAATGITYGDWYDVVMTYDGSTLRGYVNGSLTNSASETKQYPISLYYSIGSADPTSDGNSAAFSGSIDEVRVSDIARSSDWTATEYNSESSPSTFYSVGSPTTPGGGGGGGTPVRTIRLFGGFKIKLVSGRLRLLPLE